MLGSQSRLTRKENIKENTLVFAWLALIPSVFARVTEWRVDPMKNRDESFGRSASPSSEKRQVFEAPEDFAAVAAAFAKFQKRYCQSEPHTPEELRVIDTPLGF